MTKATHTPGPWIAQQSGYTWTVGNHDKSDGYVCDVHSTPENAALIASAPELLEALEKIERILRAGPIPSKASATELAHQAARAIAKARGE